MVRPQPLASLAETPIQIADGAVCELQSIEIANTNATDAWVKIYESATTPTGTSTPAWQALVPQGARTLAPFFSGAMLWIVASANPNASFAAPAAPLNGALTYEPA